MDNFKGNFGVEYYSKKKDNNGRYVMKKILPVLVVLVLIATVVPFTPAMPPTEHVTIPPEVPEVFWGYTSLTGGGVNVGGQTGSGTIGVLPGWSRDEFLDVNEYSITWKWIKDAKVVFEYKLVPGKCVKIGKLSVEFTIEKADPYWKYGVSQCSWW